VNFGPREDLTDELFPAIITVDDLAQQSAPSSGNESAAVAGAALVMVVLAVSGRALTSRRPAPRARPLFAKEPSSTSFDEYLRQRGQQDVDKAQEEYKSFKGIDQEFDGGDSGGGVVGDGNTDLEDQHNSATLGALRGGIAEGSEPAAFTSRGRVKSATDSRISSAGANYFGRSTGLAEKIMENVSEEDLKEGKMDCVRAQQKENWFNQRAIHNANRARGQGVVHGDTLDGKPRSGGYVARDVISSDAARAGHGNEEISQADLSKHLVDLAARPAERLDGEAWDQLQATSADTVTESFELRASVRNTEVVTIPVKNDYNTFAPFRCELVYPSHTTFSVSPNHGTMNRRSGEPVEIVVRYTPDAPGVTSEATIVFETEDMKKVYRFIGST
jgi:hypothetical protein